jgi:hypothetical protein
MPVGHLSRRAEENAERDRLIFIPNHPRITPAITKLHQPRFRGVFTYRISVESD